MFGLILLNFYFIYHNKLEYLSADVLPIFLILLKIIRLIFGLFFRISRYRANKKNPSVKYINIKFSFFYLIPISFGLKYSYDLQLPTVLP